MTDWLGYTTLLSHSTWASHCRQRVELVDYHDAVATTLQDPDFVQADPSSGAALFHRAGVGIGQFAALDFRIIVDYQATGEGWVRSAYFTHAGRTRGVTQWNQRATP